MYLYVDTTFGTVLGFLNQHLDWLDYYENHDQKNVSLLHYDIERLCKKNHIKINQFKGFIFCAGPGGYTGLRVSDGISQTFSWFGFETYSFYHFELLTILGIKNGIWLSNAFKGEFFCFNQEESKHTLIKESDYFIKNIDNKFYTHYFNAFSPTSRNKFSIDKVTETSQLLKSNPSTIFKQIISQKWKKELFYYRSIDQEFTKPVSPKI